MPAIYSGLDLLCSSSSFSEGFSNVIGEAMACGVPCVVTDVGDSKLIVGETGKVVPPEDPAALASACLESLVLPASQRRAIGSEARKRIEENFSAEKMVASMQAIFEDLIPGEIS
jgi:glycosyltransferase involved in cell wall biosynthesis